MIEPQTIESSLLSSVTVSYASPFSSFAYGIFQSFFLALPFSPPLLLCLRTACVQGFKTSLLCYAAVTISQTLFLSCVFGGAYSILQIWYDFEPFLSLVGCIITFQLVCSIFQETNKLPPFILVTSSFALMLCNPPQMFQVTRLTTNMDGSHGSFLIGLSIGMFFFSSLFGLLLAPLLRSRKHIANKAIVFLMTSLIIATVSHYTWRVFLQYPADLVSDVTGTHAVQRTFQPFDTNTRDRETNIQTRHREPVEQFLETYTFNEQPDIAEMQQMRTLLRYKTHFFNRFLSFWNEKRLAFRTPSERLRTPEQVERLREVSRVVHERQQQRTSPQNTGKGKTTLSYVREHST